MNLQTTFFAAALALSTLAVQAAPQEVVKLPRVVITGKAAPSALPEVAQLPRVVVNGYSEATLLRRTLAAAKMNTAKRS